MPSFENANIFLLLCRAYQVSGELVGVEDLAVVEDAFHWWQRGADEKIYLLFCFRYSLLQFCQPTIDGITFQQIFLQYIVRPATKLYTAAGFHPIAY